MTKRVETRIFKSKEEEQLEELVLDEGKYDVTLSLFVQSSNSSNWVSLQFFVEDQNTNKIPNDGW